MSQDDYGRSFEPEWAVIGRSKGHSVHKWTVLLTRRIKVDGLKIIDLHLCPKPTIIFDVRVRDSKIL